MIRGQTITLLVPVKTSPDVYGEENVTEWEPRQVENVLVAPAATTDLAGNQRVLGDRSALELHFPKTFRDSLRNCRVELFGQIWQISGDPVPFMDVNTPTPWNRPVTAELVEG